VRIGIFDAHWPTLGGGEQLAGGFATALADVHDVELVVVEPFDAIVASERLGFDLTGLPQRETEPWTRPLLEVSARYDFFVNTTFSSTQPNGAPHGLYYVHFPIPHDPLGRESRVLERLAPLLPDRRKTWIERSGFWLPEFAADGCWTNGSARLDLVMPRGVELEFGMKVSSRNWPSGRVPRVRVTVGDDVLFDDRLTRDGKTFGRLVQGRGVLHPVPVEIVSDTFVPRLESGSDDDRELGVVVSHVHIGRHHHLLPRPLESRLAARQTAPFQREFLESYGSVVANSSYTANWVERLWGRAAGVLAPPVQLRTPGEKEPIVLSVGRFFPSTSGHSKKQLELVEAFRLACERGLRGWTMHLVGGCKVEDRGYVEDVREAAQGLPVVFHVNARGEDLDELFASATIYWHGGGLGEDPELHPDRFEHFGITVVEAMSAGIVPLVYEHGGPATIVGDAGCGRTYRSIDDLADQTVDLARDDAQLRHLSALAVARGNDFAFDRFTDHVRALVAETVDVPAARGLR
jgi:glycosyltransferase involved in cell wall biosynthesis